MPICKGLLGLALAAGLCLLARPCAGRGAEGAEAPRQGPGRGWGPEQATGEPDTALAGDLRTAWASLARDAGEEWLRLEYDGAVDIAEVRVKETYNPGAVSKVTAALADAADAADGAAGAEVVLWEGEDPTTQAPADLVVTVEDEVVTRAVTVHLDTTRVPGWNEIDAVELVAKDGTRQWAARATASSTFAVRLRQRQVLRPPVVGHIERDPPVLRDPPIQRDPFARVLDRRVKAHLEGGATLEGVCVESTPGFIVIRDRAARRTLIVNKQRLIYVEGAEEAEEAAF